MTIQRIRFTFALVIALLVASVFTVAALSANHLVRHPGALLLSAAGLLGITLTVAPPRSPRSGGGQNENKARRLGRMRGFWKSAENVKLYPVGNILATVLDHKTGIRYADVIAKGQEVVIDRINLPSGAVLTIEPPAHVSLKTVSGIRGWGCPACHSAHGSGVYPSREPSADGLASNAWFYNPQTRSIHTFSRSCWGLYVEGILLASGVERTFVDAPVAVVEHQGNRAARRKALAAPVVAAEAIPASVEVIEPADGIGTHDDAPQEAIAS